MPADAPALPGHAAAVVPATLPVQAWSVLALAAVVLYLYAVLRVQRRLGRGWSR